MKMGVIAAVAEFERDLLAERTQSGLAPSRLLRASSRLIERLSSVRRKQGQHRQRKRRFEAVATVPEQAALRARRYGKRETHPQPSKLLGAETARP
jgi:DNA invertase Pin-like site-specific DNA recombinase